LFDAYDSDRSGGLGTEELKEAFEQVAPGADIVDNIISEYDTDNDHEL
jgi:hypothetical protein